MRIRSAAAAAVFTCLVAGCSATDSTPAGPTTSPAPESSYPCGLVGLPEIATAIGASSGQRTHRGAICQWTLDGQGGAIDAVFSWFVNGSLQRESDSTTALGYVLTPIRIARQHGFTAQSLSNPSACTVTVDTDSGTISWWVQYRGAEPHPSPCDAAKTLTATTLKKEP